MRPFSIGYMVALGLLVAFEAAAEVNGPTSGKAAPHLSFSQVLHAPPGSGTTWEGLCGQVVVLDFWATWCGPCRKALPHWNELVDAFKDKPVRFIAITDENQQVVEHFLKQTPIHSWVGLDRPGRSNRTCLVWISIVRPRNVKRIFSRSAPRMRPAWCLSRVEPPAGVVSVAG